MFVSICISLIIFSFSEANEGGLYEIYYNDRVIGYYENKLEAKEVCAKVTSDLNNILSSIDIDLKGFRYKEIENDISVSNSEEIKYNLLSSIKGETTLISMVIQNQPYGVVSNEIDGKKVLQRVGELYIKKGNIDKENILAIDIKSNIKYESIKSNFTAIDSIDKIAKKIISDNDKKEIVDVSVKCREKRIEDIEPNINIVDMDDMYVGERMEEGGELGSKEILSNVVYKNGIKVNEEIVSEDIIKESETKTIFRGSKNPVDDGIAFLEHPTRGGYITSNFGYRWGRNHNGLDIAHNIGDPVYSAFDGIVKECNYESGYGNKILIEHANKIETIYGHLSEFNVKVGCEVKKGDIIGKVGNTGRSTGPHLHFEVRVNGVPVDPKNYIES